MTFAWCKLAPPNIRKRCPESPPAEPVMVPPPLTRGLVYPSLARWPVMSLLCLKILPIVNPSKVDLQGRRVGLSHLLGNLKKLTYKNLIYLLNFVFYYATIAYHVGLIAVLGWPQGIMANV